MERQRDVRQLATEDSAKACGRAQSSFWPRPTALSGTQAWAAGAYTFGSDTGTLVESWNGTSWHEPSTPGPGLYVALLSIAAQSASDVWTVGFRASLTNPRILVQHWNGTKWEVVPSPSPSPHPDELQGVTVLSRTYAWAVGVSREQDPD
jgi:hypothetical protein